jgi:predicted ATP-dependent endonuclease of OLD family
MCSGSLTLCPFSLDHYKLTEKYDVEFSSLEGFSTRRMPLGINLKDKNVEVPLNDWGSGTQNRTYILMSILQANRIKTRKSAEDRVTLLVVIEEPESFLHPSAQAEFGKLLQTLSSDLGIQIIVSTHSPYMLNQAEPGSNILLRRRLRHRKLQESEVVDTAGAQWMAPFAEHLGVVAPEFDSWRGLFGAHQPRVLLVEGETDKAYFEYLREKFGTRFGLPAEVEIVPYGGKNTLKNTMLVKFMLSRFDRVFVTFDLDAADDVKSSLERLGLIEGKSFAAVGLHKSGREAIEGLLPDRVISAVTGRETDLVMQLASTKSQERNEAKRKLKAAFLEECKKHEDYTGEELRHLIKIGQSVGKCFA